jgi:hypothetical protein
MLNIEDLMQTVQGKGVVNILAADKLMNAPRLYATFLLWMLSELFERLPEVGDPDKPKLVFFFDEAHLLFNDAPKVLLERIELVVRLVRSKGVGVYFVTQNPLDVPDTVLASWATACSTPCAPSPARPEGRQGHGRDHARQPQAEHRGRHHRAGRGRGARQPARRQGPPQRDRAPVRHPARQPHRPHHRRRAQGADGRLAGGRHLRAGGGPRVGLREAGPAHGRGRSPGGGNGSGAPAAGGAADGGLLGSVGTVVKEALFGRTGPRGGQYDGMVQTVVKGEMRRMGREFLRGALGSLLGGRKR